MLDCSVPLISFLCSKPECVWNTDTRFYREGCWTELGQHWSCQCPDNGHLLEDFKDHVLHMAFDVSNDMCFHHGCPPDSCHLKLFFNKQNFSHVVVRICHFLPQCLHGTAVLKMISKCNYMSYESLVLLLGPVNNICNQSEVRVYSELYKSSLKNVRCNIFSWVLL